MGNAVFPAKLDHRSRTGNTVLGLERAWFVIETGVNDAAIVTRLVAGNARFFVEYRNASLGHPARCLQRSR